MKVLVACEESQTVCIAFRKLGIEAWSCDLQPCSGGHPEWHIQGDALDEAYSFKYDLMIAHPPCTYLANSGVCWLYKDGIINQYRWNQMEKAAIFFIALLNAPIEHIAIENPIMHKYARKIIALKYDQIIQPYQFGHPESKATCLWLKNLPKLIETNNVYSIYRNMPNNKKHRLHYLPPSKERAKIRSKTFAGIAEAMANQWSQFLKREYENNNY